jgi:acyl dehydratase
MTEWVDPYAGFQYQPDNVVVPAAYQREKLSICGIDPEVFGEVVDASFYIGLAIRAGAASGITAQGNVNMLQSLVQHRPALLDESLTVRGEITAVTEVPRGRTIDTDVWFEDGSGERVITARRRSLKPDPGKSDRGAGERPPPVLKDPAAARVLADQRLTPEIVVAYSEEGNSIHYDLEAARKAGFRAPLIGGGMGVHYLLAAIYAERTPQAFDLDIYFRRPIFWDDSFRVVRHERAMALTRQDGELLKVLTEMRINAISPR